MSSDQVIELSVEETNKLRAELGLAPLRIAGQAASSSNSPENVASRQQQKTQVSQESGNQTQDEILEMSVAESNALREKLGLPPLRQGSSATKKEIVHAPAENVGDAEAAAARIEKLKVEREVKAGMKKFTSGQKGLGEKSSSVKSWAAQMRKTQKPRDKTITNDATGSNQGNQTYDESDLKGMNVAHSLSEIQEGSTAVLTFADAAILKTDENGAASEKVVGLNDEDVQLENVGLSEQRKQQDGLREKRKMELGMGRAGGYSGFDDDEFEELGGSMAPARIARGQFDGNAGAGKTKKTRGFQIGAMLEEQEEEQESDLFAFQKGKAISLESDFGKSDTNSDFMTTEEDNDQRESRKKKKKKDSTKFSKKKKKKDKKKRRRKTEESDDDEDKEPSEALVSNKKGLLDELEATAEAASINNTSRKRRRRSDDDDSKTLVSNDLSNRNDEMTKQEGDENGEEDKRAKFDAIMAKGNKRTREAFQPKNTKSHGPAVDVDEEPDDAFLNAALSKARRLNRLREMSQAKKTRGADAVVEAVLSARTTAQQKATGETGTIIFAVDETREFTRALQARAEQKEREKTRKTAKKDDDTGIESKTKSAVPSKVETVKEDESEDKIMDISELAKEVKEDAVAPAGGLDGATGSTVNLGRGLANVLGMLKQAGDITRKNAGKEVMRGRAKDKRTYEDYESLDLSKVVKIDERRATEKDKQYAQREVNLEYRDKHGRLLTRHEAFRELCYQFHGKGSGKRKEEKKLQQIAMEQAEARVTSRQAAGGGTVGTLGALKATQKATGKAFVVHKT